MAAAAAADAHSPFALCTRRCPCTSCACGRTSRCWGCSVCGEQAWRLGSMQRLQRVGGLSGGGASQGGRLGECQHRGSRGRLVGACQQPRACTWGRCSTARSSQTSRFVARPTGRSTQCSAAQPANPPTSLLCFRCTHHHPLPAGAAPRALAASSMRSSCGWEVVSCIIAPWSACCIEGSTTLRAAPPSPSILLPIPQTDA